MVRNHPSMSRSILIVDDHEAFRKAARAVLAAEGFRVLAEAGSGEAALVAARELRPEIALVDIQLPDIDGFRVAEHLSREADAPVVILISIREAYEYAGRVETAPVAGFLPKRLLTGSAIRALLGEP
jgi:DNA-binding NarL/FixJ family response regulator